MAIQAVSNTSGKSRSMHAGKSIRSDSAAELAFSSEGDAALVLRRRPRPSNALIARRITTQTARATRRIIGPKRSVFSSRDRSGPIICASSSVHAGASNSTQEPDRRFFVQ